MVVVMMMMKELVVLVHVKNDCAFSLLNFLLSLYVCFSFAVKFDVCVCVCVCLLCTKKEKEKKKEKRRCRAHRSENEQFCVQYLHESKTLSFSFFFVLFSNFILLFLVLIIQFIFSVVYSFFLINDALAFRFCSYYYYYYYFTSSIREIRKNKLYIHLKDK
jgi:hypothetical protein